MALTYRKASVRDLPLLVRTRLIVLRAANGLPEDADLSALTESTRAYYERALADGAHAAYLVLDGEEFVGAGGISFYEVLPTCDNPSGQKAYIMNLYTAPAYRRQGIAHRTLSLLMDVARERGVTSVALEATDMGRPLYEAYGFRAAAHEMEWPKQGA